MVTQFFRKRLSSFRIIIFGFMGVILLGALLLMLPTDTVQHLKMPCSHPHPPYASPDWS